MEIPLLEIKASVDESMKSWLQRVRGSLERESTFHGKEVIYPVPMCLKKDETISFYHPKEICFGPQHFRTEAVAYKYGEEVKAEVARNFDAILKNGDAPAEDGGLLLVVKKFKEPRIQERFAKSYLIPDKSLINNAEVIAWLLVRDACFVIEVLDRFSIDEPTEAEKESKHLWQHILNRKNHHPLLNDIVKDMFKLENQLPLWVFEEMFELENLSPLWESLKRRKAGNWFEPALKNLSPVEVTHISGPSRTYGKKIHILQLLGEYMVDNRAEHSKSSSTSSKDDGNHHSGAEHSTSTSSKEDGNHDEGADEESGTCDATGVHREETDEKEDSLITYLLTLLLYVLLLLVLLPVLIVCFVMLFIFYIWEKDQKNEHHVPTIEELDKIGVKFKRLKSKGISHIKFKDSKLYLPKFTVDDRSEVILRNLLVMETHWEDTEKVMTRYVVFMNDLVNTCEDVSRLREQGIIVNNLGSDEDVARMWNSVSIPATDIPTYEPIDSVCKKINDHRKKWWSVLWAQFWRLHCSKPWLITSLLGGICLLLLTAVQVFCLFYQCQSGSSNKPGF